MSSKKGLTLVFSASPAANLAYQLDCLAGLQVCTKEVYEHRWKEDGWGREDEAALAAWGELFGRYRQSIDMGAEDAPGPLPLPRPGVDYLQRLQVAALTASDWERYRENLSLMMQPADAARALTLLDRFRPRFDKWWAKEGSSITRNAAKGLASLARGKDLPTFFGKAARFYGYDYPSGTIVTFDLVAQPRGESRHTSGLQLGDHALIEVVDGESPSDRVDVIAHELFHYFYSRAPAQRRAAFLQGLAAAPQPYSLAAYGVFDEAAATALGNGLVSRLVKTPDEFSRFLAAENSLYADPIVNGPAKAMIPLFDQWLARGVGLGDPDSVTGYLDAVTEGLGPRVFSPLLWFRAVAIAQAPGLKADQAFIEKLGCNSTWTSEPLDEPAAIERLTKHPGVNAVLFVTRSDATRLAAWESVLGAAPVSAAMMLATRGRPFIYGIRRPPKAFAYVFFSPEPAGFPPLIERFAAAPALFEGALP